MTARPASLNREILRLAVPALGALVAEPLFLLAASAFIARVSTTSLAGLGLASTVLTTIVGLAIFLAYSTTAAVAPRSSAVRRPLSNSGRWIAAPPPAIPDDRSTKLPKPIACKPTRAERLMLG